VSDIYSMPGHLVRRLQQIAVAIFRAEVLKAGYDLTPVQYAALVVIIANPGIGQAALAGLIAYDRTTIGGVVDRLVHKGWLRREVSESDRRAHILHATGQGEEVVSEIGPAVKAAQQLMLQGLEPAEVEEFLRLLRKAIGPVDDTDPAP